MDLRELLRTIRRERIPALVAFLAVLGLAFSVAASVPQQYRSVITLFVQPEKDETTFGSVQAVSFLMPALEARVGSSGLETQVREAGPSSYANSPWSASASSEPGTGLLRVKVTSIRADVPQRVAAAYATALRSYVDSADVPLRLSVLDPPTEAVGSSAQRWFSLATSGVVLGLGAAILAALAASRIRRPRRMADDIRERYGLPVLGEIPPLPRKADPSPVRLYDSDEPSSVEAFIRLRTTVEIEIAARSLFSIAVVSRGLGEGKTTVAAHLGWSLASLGHRVLLADADLRHAGLHDLIRPAVRPAVPSAHPVSGRPEAQPTALPQLTYLSAMGLRRAAATARGSLGTLHPAEAVAMGLPDVTADALAANVLMIVDSPPILGAAESKYIVSAVDATILVVDARRPLALEDLADTLRQVNEGGGMVLGVVLNRTRLSRTARKEERMYYVRRPEFNRDRSRVPLSRVLDTQDPSWVSGDPTAPTAPTAVGGASADAPDWAAAGDVRPGTTAPLLDPDTAPHGVELEPDPFLAEPVALAADPAGGPHGVDPADTADTRRH